MPAGPSDIGQFGIQGEGKNRFARYPLLDALIERRSRRFAPGMRLNGGPLAYASAKAPQPLSLEEEVSLAFSACGITGYALVELPYQTGSIPEAGEGNMMVNFIDRTVASGHYRLLRVRVRALWALPRQVRSVSHHPGASGSPPGPGFL